MQCPKYPIEDLFASFSFSLKIKRIEILLSNFDRASAAELCPRPNGLGGAAAVARILHFGVFEVDLGACELRKHGLRLKLPEQPSRVLIVLLEKPDFDHGLHNAASACAKFWEMLPRTLALSRQSADAVTASLRRSRLCFSGANINMLPNPRKRGENRILEKVALLLPAANSNSALEVFRAGRHWGGTRSRGRSRPRRLALRRG